MKNRNTLAKLNKVKTALSTFLMVGALMVSPIAQAQNSAIVSKIKTYLETSGGNASIALMPESLKQSLDSQLSESGQFNMSDPSDVALFNKLTKRLGVIFTEENIKRSVIKSMEASVSAKDLDKQIAFYATPAGKEAKRISIKSANAMQEPAFASFSQNPDSIDPARMKLVQRTISLFKPHEFLVDTGIDMKIAGFMGLTDNLTPDLMGRSYWGTSIHNVIEHMESQREPNYASYKSMMTTLEYYLYKDMDMELFKKYSDNAVSHQAMAVSNAMLRGINHFTIDAFYVVGAAMAKEVNAANKSVAGL